MGWVESVVTWRIHWVMTHIDQTIDYLWAINCHCPYRTIVINIGKFINSTVLRHVNLFSHDVLVVRRSLYALAVPYMYIAQKSKNLFAIGPLIEMWFSTLNTGLGMKARWQTNLLAWKQQLSLARSGFVWYDNGSGLQRRRRQVCGALASRAWYLYVRQKFRTGYIEITIR